jgi:hypothetical protein
MLQDRLSNLKLLSNEHTLAKKKAFRGVGCVRETPQVSVHNNSVDLEQIQQI